MKVLQINSVCGTGSTGRIAVDIQSALEENKHGSLIAYGRGKAPGGICSLRIGNDFDVKLHGMITRITDRHGLRSKKATKKFFPAAEKYDPDIIHLHNIHGYYLNIGMLFQWLKSMNKPVVWTLHDCWAFTGHCAHFSDAGCDKWKTECSHCVQKNEYPKSILSDNSKRNFNDKKQLFTGLKNMTLVTPSIWLKNIVSNSFLHEYPTLVIPNGIDLSIYQPAKSNIRQTYALTGKKILLGVANIWSPSKGLADFIALSKYLADDMRIVLIGLSDGQIASLPDNIIGVSRTDSVQELAEFYSAADVYVNTSTEETMGMTTAEALACGTPCVVYDATAVPEVIDESCGIAVKQGEISGLYDAVRSLLASPPAPSACMRRAEIFAKSAVYEKYLNVYDSKLIQRINEQ